MGIVEIENRKILLLKVRTMAGKEYYLALLYSPRPGWMIGKGMGKEMEEVWDNPDLLTPEKCNELEGERFLIYQVPPYIRGENKGKPKWEKSIFLKSCESLKDAVWWIKAEVGIKVLKIIYSKPDVLGGADNENAPDKT
ncbi:hypothetical protein [Allisonella histaminiformans]|uniref:hypothetical protein n=1 Tax=Allisonella histaminiformans TaxID=209880 RepID=UPI002E7866F1|nr:hypothetical protein [Allisonella histaminiformans]